MINMREVPMSDDAEYIYDRDFTTLANQFREGQSKDKQIYRLDMSLEQFKTLLELFKELSYGRHGKEEFERLLSDLELLKGVKKIIIQEKKRKATQKANEARSKKAKKKIENAINTLRLKNKKINYTSIAKTAEVSFVTVKKYIDEDTLKSLNESN